MRPWTPPPATKWESCTFPFRKSRDLLKTWLQDPSFNVLDKNPKILNKYVKRRGYTDRVPVSSFWIDRIDFKMLKAVFWIRFILILVLGSVSWNNGSGSNCWSDLKSRKYKLRNKTCFVIYETTIVKQNFNIFEKKIYDFFVIFVEIFHDFGWFFAYPDPFPLSRLTKWNGSGSESLAERFSNECSSSINQWNTITLILWLINFSKEIYLF